MRVWRISCSQVYTRLVNAEPRPGKVVATMWPWDHGHGNYGWIWYGTGNHETRKWFHVVPVPEMWSTRQLCATVRPESSFTSFQCCAGWKNVFINFPRFNFLRQWTRWFEPLAASWTRKLPVQAWAPENNLSEPIYGWMKTINLK